METFSVEWELNEAIIAITVHDEPPGEHEIDLFELCITEGNNNGGNSQSFYLSLDDLMALMVVTSRAMLYHSVNGELHEK